MTSPDAAPRSAPSSDDQTGGKKPRKLGDFELLGKIGQGAMGSVYLARQISQNRKVALKILPAEMAKDEEFLERFRREARAASKLAHPNVVSAYEVGVAEGLHFIAMEYVDGSDLETILVRRGPFAESDLLRIALEICSALEAAHAQGIIHRDIKPSNVLLNSKGHAKLIDLGLSSATQGDRRVTMAGFAVGTPYYISPEQARGTLDVDARADIYSLGATLYHLACGEVPFPGQNPVVIMTQHISQHPPVPHQRNPKVSFRLSALIQKMMLKDPAQRHQNAIELRGDIERCIKGEMPVPPRAAARPSQRQSGVKPVVKPRSRDEIVMEKVDAMLPFLPQTWRLPVMAVALTLILLSLLAVVTVSLRR